MNKRFSFIAVAGALLMTGCSGASVGDYLWGDKGSSPKPSQSVGLAPSQSPTASAYTYVGESTPSKKQKGLRTPPRNSQRVYVVVNDQPITGYDISQRMKLNRALGQRGGTRKSVLNNLINERLQVAEAASNKIIIGDVQLNRSIKAMTKAQKTTPAKLEAKLKSRGVSMSSLKQQMKAAMALRWIMQKRGKKAGKVSEADVSAKLAAFSKDPRLQAVTLYRLRQVDLPVENMSGAMGPQLLQARAIEAQQIAAKYRGCSTLKKASSGIYNVRVSGVISADGRKLPPQMKKALRKAGTRKLLGPMRTKGGIQMIAYCGTKRVKPPKPTREQVRRLLANEKFGTAAEDVMKELREKAYIDYKVASVRP